MNLRTNFATDMDFFDPFLDLKNFINTLQININSDNTNSQNSEIFKILNFFASKNTMKLREEFQMKLNSIQAFISEIFLTDYDEYQKFLEILSTIKLLHAENLADMNSDNIFLEQIFTEFYQKFHELSILKPSKNLPEPKISSFFPYNEIAYLFTLGNQENIKNSNFRCYSYSSQYYENLNTDKYLEKQEESLKQVNKENLNDLNFNKPQTSHHKNSRSNSTHLSHTEEDIMTNPKQPEKANFFQEDERKSNSSKKFDFPEKVIQIASQIYPKNSIGIYSWEQRLSLILKFKLKKMKRIQKRPVIKKYLGRSNIASKKLRVNGRFIKDPEKKKQMFRIENWI